MMTSSMIRVNLTLRLRVISRPVQSGKSITTQCIDSFDCQRIDLNFSNPSSPQSFSRQFYCSKIIICKLQIPNIRLQIIGRKKLFWFLKILLSQVVASMCINRITRTGQVQKLTYQYYQRVGLFILRSRICKFDIYEKITLEIQPGVPHL